MAPPALPARPDIPCRGKLPQTGIFRVYFLKHEFDPLAFRSVSLAGSAGGIV